MLISETVKEAFRVHYERALEIVRGRSRRVAVVHPPGERRL